MRRFTTGQPYPLDEGQLLTIRNTTASVSAPLPESYGIAVGAEISSPFAGFAHDGLISKFLALKSATSKVGLVTTKVYTGPEQPDVSFELHFEAYNDALREVVLPAAQLLLMTSGRKRGIGSAEGESARDFIAENVEILASKFEVTSGIDADRIRALLSYLHAPERVSIDFGKVYSLQDVYISSTNITFSNLLDGNYMPMRATVAISATLQQPIYADTESGDQSVASVFKSLPEDILVQGGIS